jgi:hypothetical protein
MSATDELGQLLRHLDSWLYLDVDRRTDRVILRVGDEVVGTLDTANRALVVNVPRGMVLRGTQDGVSVRVSDADSRTAAESLLRRRIDLERFSSQLRVASP